MSHSSSYPQQSPDASGYMTGHPRRTRVSDEYDPSEHSHTESGQSPTRSPTPVSAPSSQSVSRPRVRATARISIPPPIRETFTIPRRDEAGPSRPRDRRAAPPPPQMEEPAGRPTGMAPLGGLGVTELTSQMEDFRSALDLHRQSIDGLIGILNGQSRSIDMMVDTMVYVRRNVRTLCTYLALVLVALVVMIGLLVQIMLHQ